MRTEFVSTETEITKNVVTFLDGVHSNGTDQTDFIDMVKRGRVFLPSQFGKLLAFAPAQFIGYVRNDLENHRLLRVRNDNGEASVSSDTINKITKIYGTEPKIDTYLEAKLIEYGEAIGSEIYGKEHKFWRVPLIDRAIDRLNSAIDDIDESVVENASPEYKLRMAGSYVRDPKVRRQVLLRANGICEYGSCVTFKKSNGQAFLEAHHVISLSEQGIDKLSNVIALCPNHHREAHFGEQWQALQDEFIQILKKLVS